MRRRNFFGALAVIVVSPAILMVAKPKQWLKKPQNVIWDDDQKQFIPKKLVGMFDRDTYYKYKGYARSRYHNQGHHIFYCEKKKHNFIMGDKSFKYFDKNPCVSRNYVYQVG